MITVLSSAYKTVAINTIRSCRNQLLFPRLLSSRPAFFEEHLGLKTKEVPQQKVYNGKKFPLILEPQDKVNAREVNIQNWCNLLSTHATKFRNILGQYGVILFRGLPVKVPEDFDKFVKSFGFASFPYTGGNAPRHQVVGEVFTANEAPPDKFIPYHHEMAYQPIKPNYLFFFCETAPAAGGETSLILSSAIYNKMSDLFPEVTDLLDREGVIYERVVPEVDDVEHYIGRGWKSTFGAQSRAEAELVCENLGLSCEWLEDGSMRLLCKLPAFGYDSISGQKTWFNHIVNFSLFDFKDVQTGPRRVAYVGNGERLPADFMEALETVVAEEAVNIPWQTGDILMVDNRLSLHARQPFTPPRRVLAALCK